MPIAYRLFLALLLIAHRFYLALMSYRLRTLLDIQSKYMNDYSVLKGEFAEYQERRKSGGDSDPAFVEFWKSKKRVMGAAYCDELNHVLRKTVFLDEVPCQAHPGCLCPVSPRSDPMFRKARWSEMAGNTCSPFTTIGGGSAGWLHEATLVELVWAHSMRFSGKFRLSLHPSPHKGPMSCS